MPPSSYFSLWSNQVLFQPFGVDIFKEKTHFLNFLPQTKLQFQVLLLWTFPALLIEAD